MMGRDGKRKKKGCEIQGFKCTASFDVSVRDRWKKSRRVFQGSCFVCFGLDASFFFTPTMCTALFPSFPVISPYLYALFHHFRVMLKRLACRAAKKNFNMTYFILYLNTSNNGSLHSKHKGPVYYT